MSIRADIAELKRYFSGSNDAVELTMPDGVTIRLPLPRGKDPVLLLYQHIIANPNSQEAQLLKRCVAIIEPPGQCMILAAKALLDSPEDELCEPESPAPSEPVAEPEPKVRSGPVLIMPTKEGNHI
jgi:hypothetical protein